MQTETSVIRPATSADRDAIWSILQPVFRAGDTYAIDPDISRDAGLDYWFSSEKTVFVFEDEAGILGTYYIKQNQAGGGAHVCNCGYITSEQARGRGVAGRMCEHSQRVAVELGFRAMQFNFVVSTNEGAIRLWKKLGYEIVGNLPHAFRQSSGSYVDAHVMYKALA